MEMQQLQNFKYNLVFLLKSYAMDKASFFSLVLIDQAAFLLHHVA